MQRYSLTLVERVKWGILLMVALLDATVILATPIGVSTTPQLMGVYFVGISVSLSFAAFYHFIRHEPHFTHTWICVLQFFLFTLAGCIMTYLAVAMRFPLQDENLIHFDRSLGIHVEEIVAWVQQFPLASRLLSLVYFSLLPQFLFVFIYLGIVRGRRDPLDEFVLLMMFTLIPTTAIAAIFPAAGPCHEFGFKIAPFHQHYLDLLEYMRGDPAPQIMLNELEGMLVFPSFHSVLACMLIYVFRREKYLFPVMLVLNGSMIGSTLTHGCHYLADILAGLVVFGFGVVMLRLFLRFAEPGTRETQAASR